MALSKEAIERLIVALTSQAIGLEVANAINSGETGGPGLSFVDWNNRSLISADGDQSIDWESKQLFGLADTPTLDWGSAALYDDAQVLCILWNDRTAYDETGTVSFNWGTREVNFPSGNSAISWFNEGLVEILNNSILHVSGDLRTAGALGIGNSLAATSPGNVIKKIEVFDASGVSLGFIPVYDAIL